MLDINDTKMRYEDDSKNKNAAVCTCEPLDRGYGTTIGSSLKRILLSSLKGAAVVAIKIDGAEAIDDQLAGVKESVQEIVLNLRNLSIKPVENTVMVNFSIKAEEDTEVTVADIVAQYNEEAALEILDLDTHIATVLAGGSLKLELQIESGYGYCAAEKNTVALEGMLPLDAVYSPVKRVEYKVQNTRVGNTTDYDKLLVELETDGTISPVEALNSASSYMIEALTPLWQLSDAEVEEPDPDLNNVILPSGETTANNASMSRSEILERPIEDLELNVRPANCMKRAGIATIGDLVARSEDDVKNLRNLGSKSFEEIVVKLEERGLSLRSSELH